MYVDNINIGDDVRDKYQYQFYEPIKEKLDSAIVNIKSPPDSIEDIPTNWIIDVDPWNDASVGNFKRINNNMNDLIDYLNTLSDDYFSDNE